MDNINLFSVITIISFILLVPSAILLEGVKFTPSYLDTAVSYILISESISGEQVNMCVHNVLWPYSSFFCIRQVKDWQSESYVQNLFWLDFVSILISRWVLICFNWKPMGNKLQSVALNRLVMHSKWKMSSNRAYNNTIPFFWCTISL